MMNLTLRGTLAIAGVVLALQSHATAQTSADTLSAAQRAAAEGKSERAVELLTQLIQDAPSESQAYFLRGRENFRLGRIAESVADFDRHVELSPELEARQWERGIALYYAGKFERGARQFETYQKFDARDVENSVWRFLCMAKSVGVDKARQAMLPIENDSRVPMMEVFEMYRGTMEPEKVLVAASRGDPPAEVLAGRLFYAHLYLGLYQDAIGDKASAAKYIKLAAAEELSRNPRVNRYMWDVARIHQRQIESMGAKP